ncbi:hypothetical protein B7494_g1730 [Chlorociboria aeruginascens]|nr:hypothetical protein B7494_g1730 [Chlorociboria aeruginascens]
MPLWLIFHPTGTFEDAASKQSFAEDITKMYTNLGLPAFYAVTNFVKLAPENFYVGGKQKTDKPFIRVVINHVAHNMPNDQAVHRRATSLIDEVLRPHVYDRGYESEFHVGETERGLWKINGMIPPPSKSEEENLWIKENRAVPYEGAY